MNFTNLQKFLAGGTIVLGLLGASAYVQQKVASTKIHNAELATAALEQKVRDLQSEKVKLLAAFDAKEKDLQAANVKLANLKPLPKPVVPDSVPITTVQLAEAFTEAGFPPRIEGDALAWATGDARPMLPLIVDGKSYPEALERIEVMGEQINILSGQKDDLLKAGDLTSQQLVAKDGVIHEKDVVIGAKDSQISAEKKKKVIWGAIGVGAGFLLKIVLAL